MTDVGWHQTPPLFSWWCTSGWSANTSTPEGMALHQHQAVRPGGGGRLRTGSRPCLRQRDSISSSDTSTVEQLHWQPSAVIAMICALVKRTRCAASAATPGASPVLQAARQAHKFSQSHPRRVEKRAAFLKRRALRVARAQPRERARLAAADIGAPANELGATQGPFDCTGPGDVVQRISASAALSVAQRLERAQQVSSPAYKNRNRDRGIDKIERGQKDKPIHIL